MSDIEKDLVNMTNKLKQFFDNEISFQEEKKSEIEKFREKETKHIPIIRETYYKLELFEPAKTIIAVIDFIEKLKKDVKK